MKFRVIRAVSFIYEVEADSATEAEEKVVNGEAGIPTGHQYTDDIYTEELENA